MCGVQSAFVELFSYSVYTDTSHKFLTAQKERGMKVQVSNYIDVEAKALKLGCTTPAGLTILPRNFATATSSSEFVHESTV